MRKIFSYLIINALFLAVFSFSGSAEEPVEEIKAETDVLTWNDCLAEAARNNPNLISAKASLDQTKATQATTTSGEWPQVNATLSTSTTKSGTADKSTKSFSYGASATQLIFDGMKTVNNVKAARENTKASQESYLYSSAEVRMTLRSAFINLLKAQELIKVAEDIVKIRKDNFSLIDLRHRSGLEHKGALLTAEYNLTQANFELAQAKRNIVLVQRQLSSAMGRKIFSPVTVQGDFSIGDAAVEKPDFDTIAQNHPTLLQAVAKRNAAMFGMKSAYGNFFPTVSASGGISRSNSFWPPEDEGWNGGLSVSLPIFKGGANAAALSNAKAAYHKAEADEQISRDSVIVSLEQMWGALRDAVETVDVQRKSLEATQARSQIAQAQYSTGFITFDTWIVIENELVSAKKSYLRAQSDAVVAEAKWIQAKGETLEYVP